MNPIAVGIVIALAALGVVMLMAAVDVTFRIGLELVEDHRNRLKVIRVMAVLSGLVFCAPAVIMAIEYYG